MKFAMITTFFGQHSFGGDAAYVDRLSRALLKRGHLVDVIYSLDSFNLLHKGHPPRFYDAPEGIRIYPLRSRFAEIFQLMIHQTGKPCFFKRQLDKLLQDNKYDVIHFHNISLIGGTGLFSLNAGSEQTIKIMTTHEHWLLCPLSLLWQYGRQVCKKKECVRCAIKGGRPPQLWRHFSPPLNKLSQLDALICPSFHTKRLHTLPSLNIPIYQLAYCLSDQWSNGSDAAKKRFAEWPRPYFAAAGRLVKEKGFQNLIPIMRHFPHHDLLIAGTGPLKDKLKKIVDNFSNVHFLGLLSEDEIPALFQSATAVVMPSLFHETFGYVALEAFSVKTPVIVNRIGALPELIDMSGAGIVYENEAQLFHAMKLLAENENLCSEMGERGWQAWRKNWSEELHMDLYFQILDDLR